MALRLASKNRSESSDVTPLTEKDAGSSDSTSPQPKAGRACKALTKGGKPCRAAPTEGGFCFLHTNPEKASELGRIGGRKKYHTVTGLNPLLKLNSAAAICSSVAQIAEELHSGQLDAKVASTFAQLARLLLQALPAADVEKERNNIELPDNFSTPKISTDQKVGDIE
jgi:hypothetical protein